MHDFKKIAAEIGDLVQQKNQAYGDSFVKAGEILRILYPEGVAPDQYQDLLAVARILDKLFRIATDRDALGESPWRDLCGYSLLGVANHQSKASGGQYLQEALTAMRCGQAIPSPTDLYRETLASLRATPSPKEPAVEQECILQYTGPRYDTADGTVGIMVVKKDWQDDSWYSSLHNRLQCGPGLLFDPRLVQAVLKGQAATFHQVVADHYPKAVAPRFNRLEVQWVTVNNAFRVIQVDGGERVVAAVDTEESGFPAMMVGPEIKERS